MTTRSSSQKLADQITAEEIQNRLSDDMIGLIALLGGRGKPMRRGDDARYGRHGSLSVTVKGSERGRWFDHTASSGGGPVQYIMHQQGGDLPSALAYARSFLGLESFSDEQQRKWKAEAAERSADRELAEARSAAGTETARAASVQHARRLWDSAVPINGTLAEQYLVETRHISKPVWGWPKAIRFFETTLCGAKRRGLIVAATDTAGTVHGVQLVQLDWAAFKIPAGFAKLSFGRPDVQVAVRLEPRTSRDDNILQLAEGPETGLTMWAANGRETWITRGGLASAPIVEPRTILVAIDDDPINDTSRKLRYNLFRKWRRMGCILIPASANETRRQDKSDFNVLAKHGGLNAVYERIEYILNPPRAKPSRVTVEEARSILNAALEGSFAEASEDDEDF